jgi:hypothetical protein
VKFTDRMKRIKVPLPPTDEKKKVRGGGGRNNVTQQTTLTVEMACRVRSAQRHGMSKQGVTVVYWRRLCSGDCHDGCAVVSPVYVCLLNGSHC